MREKLPSTTLDTLKVQRISLATIHVGELNMRSSMEPAALQELALSLSRVGQLNPVYVTAAETGYELVAGHRRCAAAELLGWSHVDARILDTDAPHLWHVAWSENAQRSDVAITDQARTLSAARQRNAWTITQLAEVIGKSPSHVSEILATLDYPEPLREALDAAAISYGVARVLARCDDPDVQMYYLQQAAEYGCTVRTAEHWLSDWRANRNAPPGDGSDQGNDADQLAPLPQLVSCCCACGRSSRLGLQLLQVCAACAEVITSPPAT